MEGNTEGYNQGKTDGYTEGYEDGKSEDGKIKILDYGLDIDNSTFETVPEWMDFEGSTKLIGLFKNCDKLTSVTNINTSSATNMDSMFWGCDKLTSVSLDTPNVTDMEYMFWECRYLTDVNLSDTSNVTSMYEMFYGCWSLKTIPLLNTRKVLSFGRMFEDCANLTTIPPLDTSRAQSCYGMFFGCDKLTSLPAFTVPNLDYAGADLFAGDLPYLTDFGGLIDLKIKTTTFVNLPNLTYESCINILNGLYDFTGNGKTPSSSPANPEGVIKVHQNFLDKVGDKISIGIKKGWTITA
jgi:surface protein